MLVDHNVGPTRVGSEATDGLHGAGMFTVQEVGQGTGRFAT
jgi:hypothetical protein